MTNQRPVSPVDHDGDRQGEDEDAGEGAEAANQLPQQRLGVELVTHGGDGHQAPPADNKTNYFRLHNAYLKAKNEKRERAPKETWTVDRPETARRQT